MAKEDENGKLHSESNGQFVSKGGSEEKKGYDSQDIVGNILRNASKAIKSNEKKMTPAEKIASVHIDFTKDNVLPELNEDTLEKLGEEKNRQVLLKSSTIKRNLGKHIDVPENVMQDIIAEALYNPIDVFPANPKNPNYYHMASFVEIKGKNGLKMGLVLLDVDKNKDYFDIGHAYFVDGDNFDKAKKKEQKKD